jgi:hypothetical protein
MSTIQRRDVLAKVFDGLAYDKMKDIAGLLLDMNAVPDKSN